MNVKDLVIGICVTGSAEYWALAITTLFSLRKNISLEPTKILVATDQVSKINILKNLNIFPCEIVPVTPSADYIEYLPDLKGNHATYWKLDLFNHLNDGEMIMYIDIDAIAIKSINLEEIKKIFNNPRYYLAAVPSHRPVLERFCVTQLKSPYDYFNAGVMFGVKNDRCQKEKINSAVKAIMDFDVHGLHWHDQDIFNYLFGDSVYKLPYSMNVHTGFLNRRCRGACAINNLAALEIDKKPIIVHFSGGILLTRKWHPFKKKFTELLDECVDLLNGHGTESAHELIEMQEAFNKLRDYSQSGFVDWLMQLLGFRRRFFTFRHHLDYIISKVKSL